MEEIIKDPLSWFGFIGISVILLITLGVAVFGLKYLHNFMLFGRIKIPIADFAQKTLVIYEPVVFLAIAGLFIASNPIIHGTIIILICAVTFLQIRDYLSGRIILVTSNIMHDKKIIVGNYSGSMVKMGRFGMHILTPEGVLYLNYFRIINEGFTLSAGEELREYCQILVNPKSTETSHPELKKKLHEVLVTLPYTDWKYKPKISLVNQAIHQYEIKMLLHENVASDEVVRFFLDAGYECAIKKLQN